MTAQPSVAIAIDLGGTNLKTGVVDRQGTIVAKTERPSDALRGPDPVIADMVEEVTRHIGELKLRPEQIVGVGVGSPGPLSVRRGRIAKMANLPGWVDLPLRDRLADALGLNVALDNDGNAAAFGEYWINRASRPEDMILLTLGTGVGAGVIIDGELLHGHFENAAELGHMIVSVNGLHCPCGQRGCLEQYCSAAAVGRRVRDAIIQGEPCSLAPLLDRGEAIDAFQVEKAARAGDELCLRIWDEACLYLAIAVISLQHAFNPARVLIGGGMSKAGDYLLDRIRHHLAEQRWSLHDDLPEVLPAALGSDAGLIGAAGLIWQAKEPLG